MSVPNDGNSRNALCKVSWIYIFFHYSSSSDVQLADLLKKTCKLFSDSKGQYLNNYLSTKTNHIIIYLLKICLILHTCM